MRNGRHYCWKTPEGKQRQLELAIVSKQRWKDPELRKRMLKGREKKQLPAKSTT